MLIKVLLTRDMLSGGGILGLRYTRAIIDGSVLKSSSHTISRTQSEEGHIKPPYQIAYVVWFENIKADVDNCFNLLGISSARTSQDFNV